MMTKKFTQLNIGDVVATVGGKAFKKLSTALQMQTLTVINSNNESETATFTMPSGYTFNFFIGSAYDTSGGLFTIVENDGAKIVYYNNYILGGQLSVDIASGTFYYEGGCTLSGIWQFNQEIQTISSQYEIDFTIPGVNLGSALRGGKFHTMSNGVYSDAGTINDLLYIGTSKNSDYFTGIIAYTKSTKTWDSLGGVSLRNVNYGNSPITVDKQYFAWFTNNAKFQFTIDGTAYYAKVGMTWAEWVADTTLNTGGYLLNDHSVVCSKNRTYSVYSNGIMQWGYNTITLRTDYTHGNYDSGADTPND